MCDGKSCILINNPSIRPCKKGIKNIFTSYYIAYIDIFPIFARK